jgi:hypothetical protein
LYHGGGFSARFPRRRFVKGNFTPGSDHRALIKEVNKGERDLTIWTKKAIVVFCDARQQQRPLLRNRKSPAFEENTCIFGQG